MKDTVRIEIDPHDVSINTIAEALVMDCAEQDMLFELALENERLARASGDAGEKTFALEAGVKLRELAEWFKENQR